MRHVVDTNVAVVANRSFSPQASSQCCAECVRRITRFLHDEDVLVLDDNWVILQEYAKRLRSQGQPGVGDAFLRWVLTNRSNPNRCELVHIAPSRRGYEEFPDDPALSRFDEDDRKFVAVAAAHPDRPSILNAVDADWWEYRDVLARHGVVVDFLCPDVVPG